MTEKNAYELLLDSISNSTATPQEKVNIFQALINYIEYKYQQTTNINK